MGKLDMSVVAHLFLREVLYYSVLPRAKGGGHAAELYLSEMCASGVVVSGCLAD